MKKNYDIPFLEIKVLKISDICLVSSQDNDLSIFDEIDEFL